MPHLLLTIGFQRSWDNDKVGISGVRGRENLFNFPSYSISPETFLINSFHLFPIMPTAVATGHSGKSLLTTIIYLLSYQWVIKR